VRHVQPVAVQVYAPASGAGRWHKHRAGACTSPRGVDPQLRGQLQHAHAMPWGSVRQQQWRPWHPALQHKLRTDWSGHTSQATFSRHSLVWRYVYCDL
jgi:hypothetical protein